MDLVELLQRVHPFRFLRQGQRQDLIAGLTEHRFQPGEIVFRRHDTDQSVFIVASGAVEVFDPRRGPDDLVTVIRPNHFFGEWEAIFQEPRLFSVRSRSECTCFAMTGDAFRTLLQKSPTFAQGFGSILRDNQGIFSAFERFKTQLLLEAEDGQVGMTRLLPLYRALQPAIHPGLEEPRKLDLPALHYAVRRLPGNVTRTFAFLLVDELSEPFDNAESHFSTVPTAARRRDVWEVLPGKDLVLLRSGDSDLIDMLTCLCLYAVEARKIRERVSRDGTLHRLDRFVDDHADHADHEVLSDAPSEKVRDFLNTLPFSSREVDGLMTIWGPGTARKVSEITRHREMFSIDVRRRERNYNARRSELWTAEVARMTKERTGFDPADLPDNRGVHIVSSNTHSVTNCLNPWIGTHQQDIIGWADSVGHPGLNDEWRLERDYVYSVLPEYFTANPGRQEEYRVAAEEAGQHRLDRTSSTGIQVQLIDLSLVAGAIDPEIRHFSQSPAGKTDYIVNIDYAFGEQAEYVIRNLLMLFGENIRSVNFLGKAGALVGKRGDILAPTAFVEQHSDLFQPLPGRCIEPLHRRFPQGEIHEGPLLTVDGTLLQNRQMLNFYRQIWDVIGIEMEGTHYYRGIVESGQLGVIGSDVDYRFFYYVSDLPLQAHSNLAAPMKRSEGVPPLYAITRHILDEISSGGTQ
jgi:hypothetical protein